MNPVINIYLKIFFILILVVFSSCRQYIKDPRLSEALKLAGENRSELEKVLHYYSDPADSLKYKAASFLIKFMPGKYAKVFPDYDRYRPIFDTLSVLNADYEKKAKYLEFYKFYKRSIITTFFSDIIGTRSRSPNFEIKEDLKTITSDYLIENIDYAFKAWKQPWARHLNFEEFCEYLLPYRYGNEELQPWRKTYYENNIQKLLDSLKNETDPVKVCLLWNKMHETSFSELSELGELNNAIRPLDLLRINTSTSCIDQSGMGLLRMRGLGIPVTVLNVPYWGNRGSGHDFNGVLNRNKKWISFQTGELGPGKYKFPEIYFAPKIFAKIYSLNTNSTYISQIQNNYKTNPGYIDVTSDIIDVTDVTIPFESSKSGEQASLCIFNNAAWVPIVTSTIQNGKAIFPKIGRNIVYIAATISGGEFQLSGAPFLLDSNGVIKPIEPLEKNQRITVDRKYPNSPWIIDNFQDLENGEFQGDNDSSFIHPTTLWKIDKIATLNTKEKEVKNSTYKYIRFVFPPINIRNEGLADIMVYSQNDTGKIILNGEPFSSTRASKTFYKNIFDNSPLNYVLLLNEKYADFPQFYDGNNLVIPDKKPFWVGLKFKDKMKITALGITPRTDDNSINKGEMYELFYWDGQWISLGKKTATSNTLHFNTPQNALLLLKNVNKGKEHRIFLYQDNKQIWY